MFSSSSKGAVTFFFPSCFAWLISGHVATCEDTRHWESGPAALKPAFIPPAERECAQKYGIAVLRACDENLSMKGCWPLQHVPVYEKISFPHMPKPLAHSRPTHVSAGQMLIQKDFFLRCAHSLRLCEPEHSRSHSLAHVLAQQTTRTFYQSDAPCGIILTDGIRLYDAALH